MTIGIILNCLMYTTVITDAVSEEKEHFFGKNPFIIRIRKSPKGYKKCPLFSSVLVKDPNSWAFP